MARPVITSEDMARFMETCPVFKPDQTSVEANNRWQEENGLTTELTNTIAESLILQLMQRLMVRGEDLESSLFNTLLCGFQLGWELHREFGEVTTL